MASRTLRQRERALDPAAPPPHVPTHNTHACTPSPPSYARRHLPKCFDNVHSLEFRKDEATGAPTKAAIGMYSGEGEYVPFAADCLCEGPVEVRG